jgi:flagellar motility protein MotE (MotC chaperone)
MRFSFRPRLLPALAVAAALLLGFKVADLVTNGMGTVARAQPATPAAQPAATNAVKPASPAPPAAPSAPAPSTAPASSIGDDPQALSPSEIEVLQQLSQRRAALDQRAGELDQREVLLQATEKRIDDKIAKLQDLQKSIEVGVQKQNAEDDAHLQSLVKIYEAMKPKDAAQIFEQLDMPVLLSVLKRMKELKTAPILAAMDPVKAKMVTTALAQKRNQNDPGPGAANAPGAPAPNL